MLLIQNGYMIDPKSGREENWTSLRRERGFCESEKGWRSRKDAK